jgi:hypothetical protein
MNRVGTFGLVAAVAAALESGLSVRALAQGTTAPGVPAAEPSGGAGTLIAVAIIGALVVGLAVMVKMIDARRRREDKIAGVQGRLSDTLAADAMFARIPITVTVHGPGWGSGPATIVMSGSVPNEDMREAARRLVETEARGRLDDFRIVDRMAIDQMAWQHAA